MFRKFEIIIRIQVKKLNKIRFNIFEVIQFKIEFFEIWIIISKILNSPQFLVRATLPRDKF